VRIDLAVILVLGLLSLAARMAVHLIDDMATFPNTLAGTFFWFSLGMALAIVSVAAEGREERYAPLRLVIHRPWIPWAGAAVVMGVLAWALGLPRAFPNTFTDVAYLGEHVLFGVFAFLLLLPAVFGDAAGGWPRRVLANRVLAWLGLISYGLYLWHVSLMIWLNEQGAQGWIPGLGLLSLLLPSVLFAVACATASYYLLERPILRFKDPRPPRRAARAATATS
jgi:peptidoglycan/LPS O-acetylase OafA/YrhL